jgi:hypothetical protein
MSKNWTSLAALTLALLAAAGLSVAWAGPGKDATVNKQEQGEHGQGEHAWGQGKGGHQRGAMRGRIIHGKLTLVSVDSWTIHPEIPPEMAERMKQRAEKRVEKGKKGEGQKSEGKNSEGQERKLPDSITVRLGSGAKFYLEGQEAKAGDFKAGDKVVVKLDKPWKEEGASIEAAADPETAREFILEKMREGREGREKGQGRGAGPGGEGRGRHGRGPGGPLVAFGTVTALSADSITIKPEVPDFIEQWASARASETGRELPERPELPAELTFKLSTDTKFALDCEKQSVNPFKVGDKVGILPERPGHGGPGRGGPDRGGPGDSEGPGWGRPEIGGPEMGGPPPPPEGDDGPGFEPGGEHAARIVSDYASAQARMEEMRERREERRAQRAEGRGEGRGRRGEDCD